MFPIFTSAKEVMFSTVSISLLVGWLVCQQEYIKNTEWISVKLYWGMVLSRKQTPSTFGEDPNKGMDPEIFFLPFFNVQDWVFC